jgi:coenzyme F420-reducing hydrogenase beta subunit
MDALEETVHGRQRRVEDILWKSNNTFSKTADEGRFGVLHEPIQLAKGNQIEDAQWTGLVTGIALSMLESNQVDAVICVIASNGEWNQPEPIIAKTREQVLQGRGVKPALAPSLKVLDDVKDDPSIRKLLFCGVGCAVQAFRSVEHSLNLEQVFVLGTNCADNSPTPEAAENFLKTSFSLDGSQAVRGYEFMQDYRVHVKLEQEYTTKPYFCLPGSIAEPSIARSCRACFDYTNGLADVVVGYMGAPLSPTQRMDNSLQTLTVRNQKGSTMVQTAVDAGRITIQSVADGSGSHELLAVATTESDALVLALLGDTAPENGMPLWLGEIFANIIQQFGPKGLSFARYSIDYHILRNYLHCVNEWGDERATHSMPAFSRAIVDHYMSLPDQKLSRLRDRIVEKATKQ